MRNHMTELKLRIGSRKSELALKQTYIIEDLLKKAYPGLETEIVQQDTLGDKNLISHSRQKHYMDGIHFKAGQ